MANIARSLSAFLAAATLAACSSPGVAPAPEAPTLGLANGAIHDAKGRLVLRIRIPRKKKRNAATPRYISPATKAITISISGPADVSKTAALTPGAPGCSQGVCAVTVLGLKPCPSSASCYVATIATYDAVAGCPSACTIPKTAHELSGNQRVPFTIARARVNKIGVTLDGVPTSVVLVPEADSTLSGSMASGFSLEKCDAPVQYVDVVAVDADHNYVLGVGAPTPSMISNDAADLPVTAGPSPSSPNRFTLTPPTKAAANKVVQLTIGATPLGGSGALPVTTAVNVTFGDVCGVYVADYGNNAVKEILPAGGSVPASPTIDTLDGAINAAGVAVDAAGNVYVAGFGEGAVQEILAVDGSIPPSPVVNTLASGFSFPFGVAVDGSGNVYLSNSENTIVNEILAVAGTVPASPIIRTLSSGVFLFPQGLAIDGSGNVFVADYGNDSVSEILAVNGSIPASPAIRKLSPIFNHPQGVAVDGAGNVYVADTLNNAVKEIVAVDGSIPASPTVNTLGSGFSAPEGVAVDGSGNVYVADSLNNAVKEIVAIGGSIPASPTIITLGSGFSQPEGVAVR